MLQVRENEISLRKWSAGGAAQLRTLGEHCTAEYLLHLLIYLTAKKWLATFTVQGRNAHCDEISTLFVIRSEAHALSESGIWTRISRILAVYFHAWASEGGSRPPGFWKFIFYFQIFNKKDSSLSFEYATWNSNTVAPPGEILLATPGKTTIAAHGKKLPTLVLPRDASESQRIKLLWTCCNQQWCSRDRNDRDRAQISRPRLCHKNRDRVLEVRDLTFLWR